MYTFRCYSDDEEEGSCWSVRSYVRVSLIIQVFILMLLCVTFFIVPSLAENDCMLVKIRLAFMSYIIEYPSGPPPI